MEDKGFLQELTSLINRYSKENESDTPDFILSEYIRISLHAFTVATRDRDSWHGFKAWASLDAPILPPSITQTKPGELE